MNYTVEYVELKNGKKPTILTHGFIKKTEKTPRKEIERAKELRSFYHKGKEKI